MSVVEENNNSNNMDDLTSSKHDVMEEPPTTNTTPASNDNTLTENEHFHKMQNLPTETLIEKVNQIASKKEEWRDLSALKKLKLIDEIMDNTYAHLDGYHEAALRKRNFISTENCETQHLDAHQAAETLNWLQSAGLLGVWLSVIREYYDSLVRTGAPPKPAKIRKNYNNTTAITLNLTGFLMKLLTTFGTLELHVDGEEVEQENILERKGGVAVVLGAGNYDAPIDLLSAMFVENKVCIYKFSPLSRELAEPVEQAFMPLVREGYLMFLHGDASEGHTLLTHPLTDKWYLTGAAATANRILWGHPEPPSSLSEKPLVEKECMLELGNCSPWIVCPGQWSNLELHCHAKHMALAMLFNGGHICVHPQVIVTCKNWPQREDFLRLLREYQEATPVIGCFYPDYKKRIEAARDNFMAEGKTEEEFCLKVSVANNHIIDPHYRAALFATDLKTDSFLTREEMFCNVSGEIPLDVPNNFEEFLSTAVKFCNEKCHGNLAASISAKPGNDREKEALDRAVVDLKYGNVSVNAFPLMTITFPNLAWGAYPGGNIHNFESGIGFLGNCNAYKNPLKSVFRAPFLNMCHVMMVLPSRFTCGRLSKLWRRSSYAMYDRRGSAQSYWNAFSNTLKMASAMILNV